MLLAKKQFQKAKEQIEELKKEISSLKEDLEGVYSLLQSNNIFYGIKKFPDYFRYKNYFYYVKDGVKKEIFLGSYSLGQTWEVEQRTDSLYILTNEKAKDKYMIDLIHETAIQIPFQSELKA